VRACENCGGAIPPQRRSNAKFCKDRCKREAFDKRHRDVADAFYAGFAGIRRRRPAIRAAS
jgi:predicted nucleic acid-binding Zn ribbon protein